MSHGANEPSFYIAEHETSHEQLTAEGFRQLVEKSGLDADTAEGRVEQLKSLDSMDVALLWDTINRSLQGSSESRIKEGSAMRIGDQETIGPAHRYDVFMKLMADIKNAPEETNPSRIGDVLALGLVLLHPFQDGNGRTARTMGLLFRDEYDAESHAVDYDILTESRDAARERGGFLIYGYTPKFPDRFDQSNPEEVSAYLTSLLNEEKEGAYIGPYGQATLNKNPQQT